MRTTLAIRTSNLWYSYTKDSPTLVDINLQVNRGDIYGFLGPNGSGKTTTLSLLLGLLRNQRGSIEILGREYPKYRKEALLRTGSLIESPSLYSHLTAKENLDIYRRIYNASKARVHEVLAIVGLPDTGKKTVRHFSLGMRQRLAIALTLLPSPELLILDEPTNGLDPSGIMELRNLIHNLNSEEGITFLISSHLLAEVERIVNRVGIIYKGRLQFQGSLEELHKIQQKESRLKLLTSDNTRALSVLRNFSPQLADNELLIPFSDDRQVAEINRLLVDHQLDVYLLHPQKQTLETLFMNLTTSIA